MKLAKPLGALALVLGLLAAADTAAAARAERSLAPPGTRASIAGFPYALSVATGEYPRVGVEALDAQLPGGLVGTVSTDVINYSPGAEFTTGTADVVRRRVRLDPVGFGELLGITDLDIANPYDISPSGGVASEARLTGTVPGAGEATVVVTLRIADGVFRMRPSQLIDASPDHHPTILNAFTLDLDTRELPLGGPADLVQVRGGSIEFSSDRINTAVTASDFDPFAG